MVLVTAEAVDVRLPWVEWTLASRDQSNTSSLEVGRATANRSQVTQATHGSGAPTLRSSSEFLFDQVRIVSEPEKEWVTASASSSTERSLASVVRDW